MTDEALLAAIRELKDEVRESRKESQDMRDRMARMEGKLDVMNSIKETAETAKDTANEALQYSKSAHHRIDEANVAVDKNIGGMKESFGKDIGKLQEHDAWLTRSTIAALLLGCGSLVMFLFQNYFKH